MENKKFLGQTNELGPNHGKAIRTETERRNLGVYLSPDADISVMFWVGTLVATVLLVCLLVWLV